jgi:hypothetical protein
LATPTVCVPGSHTAQKHAKNELGWADFRVTDYASIERWWELVSCTYLLVSLQSPVFQLADDTSERSHPSTVGTPPDREASHRWWDSGQGWKNILNNLRLILQPYVFHCLLLFDIPGLRAGFFQLIGIMNSLHAALPI